MGATAAAATLGATVAAAVAAATTAGWSRHCQDGQTKMKGRETAVDDRWKGEEEDEAVRLEEHNKKDD